MRIFLLSLFAILFVSLSGQNTSFTEERINEIILSAEKEGFLLVEKEKCSQPPGEMCKIPFSITPDYKNMQVMVIGNHRSKPSLAVEDKETRKVITFTSEDDVSPNQKINLVTKQFNLHNTELDIVLHFGNTRSFDTEDTYMLVFTQ